MSDDKLARFIAAIDDDNDDMTDEDVRAELTADGIDLDAAQARFEAFLDEQLAQRDERMKR
jgi:hypothetical protein